MRIYTRVGDGGNTSLYTPKGRPVRVAKNDVRVEAYGTVDEVNAWVGMLRSKVPKDGPLQASLAEIQQDLFHVGYTLSTPQATEVKIRTEDIARLERLIDELSEALPPLRSFVLPAGGGAASCAHVLRTVCRRAERQAVAVSQLDPVPAEVLSYLNRLSDFAFVLARRLCLDESEEEGVVWR